MKHALAAEPTVFLSALPASDFERRFARGVALVSLAGFLLAAPFARVKLPEVWAFIPGYEAALFINDLITAVLLFAQFVIYGSPTVLILAAAYVFTALIMVPHALSFPRLFAPDGLIGGGSQTTAWIYFIWHAGFPIAVILYARLRDRAPVRRRFIAIATACAIVLCIVVGATIVTTEGHALLPVVMRGDGYTRILPIVVATVWSLSVAALLVLWKRRPHTVLDLWLMVVMVAWVFDVALSAMLNAGRFDFGFYVGRAYGLLAASLVLLVLLIEIAANYARLARSFAAERLDRNRELQELQAELIHVSRLTELGQMVSALAHEVNQPLTAVGSYIRAGRRLLQAGEPAKADDALQRAVDQITRASQVIQRLRQFVRKDDSERGTEDVRRTIEEAATLAMLGAEGRRVRLDMQFAPDVSQVFIDKVRIQQVLLNLIRNAVEAMQASVSRELVIRTMRSADGMVEVSVSDTGPGLAPEIREKLFQPFMTTKSAGMGVGLSICRSIVEAHGGRIWVGDCAGGGTAFHFTLPTLDPSLERP